MAGALKGPSARGRVKLDVVTQQPTNPETPKAAETVAPNPNLEAALTEAAAEDTNREVAASNADGTKKGKQPKKSVGTKVLEVAKTISDAADPRPSRKIPTAEEWEPFLQRGLVYLSVFYIWWLTTDDEGNEIGDPKEYELDDERAGLIVAPLARVWARTPFNRRYGRDLIENIDVLVALAAMVTYVMDTRPLWIARRRRQLARQNPDNNVIPMRRPQNTNVRKEPQPLEQVKREAKPAPAEPQTPQAPTNGGTQPHVESEGETTSPFKSELQWTPGEHNRSD